MSEKEAKDGAPPNAMYYKIIRGDIYYYKRRFFTWYEYSKITENWHKHDNYASIYWLFGWWWESPIGTRAFRIKPL